MSARAASAAVVAFAVALAPFPRARAAETDAAGLEKIERELGEARKRLILVRQYAEKGDIAPLERANQRFSEAETQFLLDSFEDCAALLLDVVDVPEFKAGQHYPQALYYLGESFYQTEAYIESLRYFRLAIQKLALGKLYQDSMVRLIDLSDRTGDVQGIDQFFDAVQRSGNVRPEVTYLYAKWLAHRQDLALDVRTLKADEEFSRLQPGQPFYAQALFFRGAVRVVQVQAFEGRIAELQKKEKNDQQPELQDQLKKQIEAKLEEAAEFNRQILKLPEPTRADPKFKKARDLANLALARVFYEQGKLSEAADRYTDVARESDDYNDALFETAATYVKMNNYEQALRTSEILLIIGKDSTVAPEAKVLQGNLQLKLGQYVKASDTFSDVVQSYSPVHDQIKALLGRPNPVDYFDELLQRSGQGLDILQLLPTPARPFVKLDKQVAEARVIASELGLGKKGIQDSQLLAKKLLDTLAAGKLNLFPQLQDGNSFAIQQSNTLAGLEGELVKLQVKLLGDDLPDDVRQGLLKLEEERQKLDEKFKGLPRSQEQYEERKGSFLKRIGELDRLAFTLANKVSELRANLVGLQIYWKTTRDQRKPNAALDLERQTEFDQDLTLIDQLDEERLKIVKQVETERATISGQATGGQLEEDLRTKYRQQLATMQALIVKMLPVVRAENKPLLTRIQQARLDVDVLQTELSDLRTKMRMKAQAKSDLYRREVLEQQAVLEGYQREVDGVDGRTRHLLGEIAFDSFSRVGQQFYDIVLKADVGLVDVAWTRKKEKSDRISALGKDKDDEITRLQERFKEVLNDAD